ncbi:restriction endonuclease [Carbonactinospora thermoautotrophica]|uniref:restriction endonuclease n=1 Tax=Carbonactinospora thermoautotrophica TaxID=1469144 RepID=UPI00082A2884|nr:restriction endonuclease [Carbonactinospora thermoautotrophica]
MGASDQVVPFERLATADLVLDAVYAGGRNGNVADDPLARLLPVGNQGGFRYAGSPWAGSVRLAVLYTTGTVPDWPDTLDPQTGLFTYYGDNRSPGRELHETSRGGNLLLRDAFAWSHGTAADRLRVPPFLLFEKASSTGRDVRFRGLLAPGAPSLTPDEELQAIWRSTAGLRFQNYRARFTVLDTPRVPRAWLDQVLAGDPLGPDCPPAWRAWVEARAYHPLTAPATTIIRTRAEQTPADPLGQELVRAIYDHFAHRPHDFEACAVEIWRLMAPATGRCELTPPSRDGGRDAVGQYLLGPAGDRIGIEFALEAKCYAPGNAVGVREVSRLISRLRHRTFGVFVTTSHFDRQVYQEVREDGHPIVLICARDIADTLRAHGYATPAAVKAWLTQRFPPGP